MATANESDQKVSGETIPEASGTVLLTVARSARPTVFSTQRRMPDAVH